MADVYAPKQLPDQILVDMKRRAAFIAKCSREALKISTSNTLKIRVLSQYTKLNEACGLGTPTALPTTWDSSLAQALTLSNAAKAVANSVNTEAAYTAAHSTAKQAFANLGYVNKLVFK